MNFEEYIEKQIPNWKSTLDLPVIEKLKEIYDSKNRCEKILNNILDMCFNLNKSGIDYSTDFEKAREQLGYYQDLLFTKIETLKQSNIENSNGIVK